MISATGSSSVIANNLVLHASPVPNNPGLFFYGPNSLNTPLGNGTLCISGPTHRLAVVFASGNQMSSPLDLTAPPGPAGPIVASSNWFFQGWFRDPAAGGAGFDLSNSLKVTFHP